MRFHLLLLVGLFLSAAFTHPAMADEGLQVDRAWTRATPPGTDAAAIYLRIANTAANPADRLLGASSSIAAKAQLHSHKEENGLLRMRPVTFIAIPPGEIIEAQPGGLHVMLNALVRPLTAGQTFPLTLHFEHAGDIAVPVDIKPLDTESTDVHQHHEHHH